jgi:hypothetical protein
MAKLQGQDSFTSITDDLPSTDPDPLLSKPTDFQDDDDYTPGYQTPEEVLAKSPSSPSPVAGSTRAINEALSDPESEPPEPKKKKAPKKAAAAAPAHPKRKAKANDKGDEMPDPERRVCASITPTTRR